MHDGTIDSIVLPKADRDRLDSVDQRLRITRSALLTELIVLASQVQQES